MKETAKNKIKSPQSPGSRIHARRTYTRKMGNFFPGLVTSSDYTHVTVVRSYSTGGGGSGGDDVTT